MLVAVAAQVAFPGVMLLPAFGDGGEDAPAAGVVDPRPNGDLVNGPKAARTQAGQFVHLAHVDAGRGDHQMIMYRWRWSCTRSTAACASSRRMRVSIAM